MSLNVAVGSTNPTKIQASQEGIEAATGMKVEAHGYSVASGVSDQPCGEEETMSGATNRAISAWQAYFETHQHYPDYSIGLEGGISSVQASQPMACFATICVYDGKRIGTCNAASFPLPHKLAILVRGGLELGDACDTLFGSINSKQAGGVVGHLTAGVVTRKDYYRQPVVLAMARFKYKQLYEREDEGL